MEFFEDLFGAIKIFDEIVCKSRNSSPLQDDVGFSERGLPTAKEFLQRLTDSLLDYLEVKNADFLVVLWP